MKASSSLGWAWPREPGTKPRARLRHFYLVLGFSLFCCHCSSLTRSQESSAQVTALAEVTAFKDSLSLVHPTAPTAIATQSLLYQQKNLPTAQLSACMQSLRELALASQNETDLVLTSQKLAAKAAKEPQLYHWCFYSHIAALDQRLRTSRTVPLRDLAQDFVTTMSELWLLAKALEQCLSEREYFSYLRQRYVTLSQQNFGRNLGVIGPALDLPPPPEPPSQKPAGLFLGD